MRRALVLVAFVPFFPTARPPVFAQFLRPDDRALFTDFSYVTAVAATNALLFAATPTALVVYDRTTLRWRETVGPLEGFPAGGVTVMVADPFDDTAWLAGRGQWHMYRGFGRQWESGPLPGRAHTVVLDRDNAGRGAWFQTSLGWYFVERGGGIAVAGTPPPAPRRIAPLTAADMRRTAHAIDAVLPRVTRDEALRSYEITAATASATDNQLYVGTDGNGVFRVDPLGYATERLPAGLLSIGAFSLAAAGRLVCAGSDVRGLVAPGVRAPARRGVACFSDDFGEITAHEAPPGVVAVGSVVRDVAVGPRGVVWAASDAGLVRFGRGRPVRLTATQGLPSDDVRALAITEGGVWAGTQTGLALVSDDDRPEVTATTSFGAAIGALLVLRDTLWIGSAGGLVLLAPGASEPRAVADHPALRGAVVALAALHDTLVVAVDHRVVWRAGGTWSSAGANVPDVGNVNALWGGAEGLWAAGSGGLARLEPRTLAWTSWTSATDLPLPVTDVLAAARYVWLATPAGVVRLDRRALDR